MIEWLEKSTKPVGRLLSENGWQTFLVVNMNEQTPKPRTMIYNNNQNYQMKSDSATVGLIGMDLLISQK